MYIIPYGVDETCVRLRYANRTYAAKVHGGLRALCTLRFLLNLIALDLRRLD